MKPHKWAKEIKAWADGGEIEWRWEILIDGKPDFWRLYQKDNKLTFFEVGVEYRIKPQTSARCIVKDCKNHTHEGRFVGELCAPCWDYITNGKGVHSQAYRNAQPKEPQYLYAYEAGGQYQLSFLKSESLMFPYGGTMEIFKYKGKIKLEVDDEV